MKYTTNFALHAVLQATGSYGVDVDAMLKRAQLGIPDLHDDPEHIPATLTEQVVKLALQETGDPAISLRIAEYIYPTTLREFSISLLSSSSVRDFLQRLAKYYPAISTTQKLRFVIRQQQGILISHFTEPQISLPVRAVWVEIAIAFAVRFIRMVYQPDYRPLRVEFTHAVADGAQRQYQEFFGVAPCFNANRNALFVDGGDLDVPLLTSNATMAAEYELKLSQRIAQMREKNLSMQVYTFLLNQLPGRKISKEDVAQHFAMSSKTLQNKLRKSGSSFQQILDAARLELANISLSRSDLSLADIAEQLGYNDTSNFCRAYKRWTGHSPRVMPPL